MHIGDVKVALPLGYCPQLRDTFGYFLGCIEQGFRKLTQLLEVQFLLYLNEFTCNGYVEDGSKDGCRMQIKIYSNGYLHPTLGTYRRKCSTLAGER